MESAPNWVLLARILRPQGRKGEVLADLFTDFPERFAGHPSVWLAPAGCADRAGPGAPPTPPDAPASGATQPSATAQLVEVIGHWLPSGRNSGRIVLQFAGVDSIEKAGQLAGKEVIVPMTERLPLSDGAAYVSDLLGSTVYDGEEPLGAVESVEFPTSADGSRRIEEAAALLVVRSVEGEEILIPFANEFLVKIDAAAKVMWMKLPNGLTEINKRASEPGHEE